MPSTYEAVQFSLGKVFENNEFEINTVLDVGAGTGTATWATFETLGIKEFLCLEREDAMINVGKRLMEKHPILKQTKWKKFDIIRDEIDIKSDIVIASYMINEIAKNDVERITEKLWDATNKVLLILEPGTPHGFSNIKHIRSIITKNGGSIIAPCTHENNCPLPDDDWCSFTCRVQRSKTQKKLKDGVSGFEDEKFSYIAFSKNQTNKTLNRILRHPMINKGYIEFKICTQDGIKNVKLSKKDGEIYKLAKKKNAGESLKLE